MLPHRVSLAGGGAAGIGVAAPWLGRSEPNSEFLSPPMFDRVAAEMLPSAGGTDWPSPVALGPPRLRSRPGRSPW